LYRNPESKKRIASWIIENMPEHHSYLDPYFGGGGMFFQKPLSKIEMVNDLRSMQSHGFRLTEKCGWKKDVHGREAAYAVRNWNRPPESLADMAIRLKGVLMNFIIGF